MVTGYCHCHSSKRPSISLSTLQLKDFSSATHAQYSPSILLVAWASNYIEVDPSQRRDGDARRFSADRLILNLTFQSP